MMTLPLLNYIAIYYTDTLTLPFPILALYLWLCAKENYKKKSYKKATLQVLGAVLSITAGSLLKISVVIVLVAIVIDAFLCFPIKKSLLIFASIIAFFCMMYFPANYAIMHAPFLPEDNPEDYIPRSHWIMMGLHDTGTYYDPDYKLTLSIDPELRDEFVKQEIQNRISDYGFFGLLAHQAQKTAFVWGDGDYFTHIKMMRDRANPSSLDQYVIYDGERHAIYAYYCQFLQLINISAFVLAAWYMLRNKAIGNALLPYTLSVFGLFLFQNLWEARSRYLLNFLPIFIVITICIYTDLFDALDKKLPLLGKKLSAQK
jgi:hypothetical protein